MTDYYYHSTIRKIVVAFASLFNDIYISRKGADGNEIERFRVPIAYGPKQKFLSKLDRLGGSFDQTIKLETYLPRLAFEITNLQYDSSRKLNTIQKTVSQASDSNLYGRYERVPYNMSLTLSVMAKTMDDNLQIMEQILPMFGPEFTFTIKAVDPTDMDVDVPLVFSSTTMNEGDDGSYGDYANRKVTMSNIQFVAKMYLYGPVNKQKIITQADIRVLDTKWLGSDIVTPPAYAEISTTPKLGVTPQDYDPMAPIGSTNGADIVINENNFGDTIFLPPETFGITSLRLSQEEFESETTTIWNRITQTMAYSYDIWSSARSQKIGPTETIGNPNAENWKSWFVFACEYHGFRPQVYDEVYPPAGNLPDISPVELESNTSSFWPCGESEYECLTCEQYWNKYLSDSVQSTRMLIDPTTLPPGPPGVSADWYSPGPSTLPIRVIPPIEFDPSWRQPIGPVSIPKFPCQDYWPLPIPLGDDPSHKFWPRPPQDIVNKCCGDSGQLPTSPGQLSPDKPCRLIEWGGHLMDGGNCEDLHTWWNNWFAELRKHADKYVERVNPAILPRRNRGVLPGWYVNRGYVPYLFPGEPGSTPLEDLQREYNICNSTRGPIGSCNVPIEQPDIDDPHFLPLSPWWWEYWNNRIKEYQQSNPCGGEHPLKLPVLNRYWLLKYIRKFKQLCPSCVSLQCPSGLLTINPFGTPDNPSGITPITPNGYGHDGDLNPSDLWKPWRYYPPNQNGCWHWVVDENTEINNCISLPADALGGGCLCLGEDNVYRRLPPAFCN